MVLIAENISAVDLLDKEKGRAEKAQTWTRYYLSTCVQTRLHFRLSRKRLLLVVERYLTVKAQDQEVNT